MMENIPALLRQLIGDHGLTQASLAEKLGIKKSKIADILRFKQDCPYDVFCRTVEKFHIDPELAKKLWDRQELDQPRRGGVESMPSNTQTVEIYENVIQERSDTTPRRWIEQPSGLTAGEQRMLALYRQAGPDGQPILEALADALIEPVPSRWLKVGQLLQAAADRAGKKG